MSYNGVSFIRQLMQTENTRQIVLPIVFTCGIDSSDANNINKNSNILFGQPAVYGITQTPQIFLHHHVYEHDGQLSIYWDHIEQLFPPYMLADMQHLFKDFLTALALSDESWRKPIHLSLPSMQQQRRHFFLQTQCNATDNNKLLHTIITEQAERTSDAWAVYSSRGNLTYKQLVTRAYPLAHYLQQQGAKSNQLIAILMEKGWEQIVACLAILLSGAAYLPLDVDSPHDRLCTLIEEANVKIILTQSHCLPMFAHLTVISVDKFTDDVYPAPFPIKQQLPTDLAYVIYTSGSTGKPKGVMISHQAVLNTILDMNSRLEISANDRIFALSHLNFDLSVFDIFGALTTGAAIVIPDHQYYKDPKHWHDLLIEHRVTIWNSVPMLMQMLIEHLKESYIENDLRHVLLSGDWIPLSLPKSIATTFGEHVTITSLGGATEASIWSIAYPIPKQMPREWKSIPYGMPLRNQRYYVYDSHLNDCPEWVTGELYIGGVGLADGYWKDQVKTESSFIIHPYTRERLYRTGDYGRFLPSGYIEFVGRKDFQVKLHGHRIELGEIEYHLEQHRDIHQAIVTIDNNEFLSVLTPITVEDQAIPKYRYASVESLYPVQVYIEVFSTIDNILPGLYYHNPDKHSLEFINDCTDNDNVEMCLHLVGRSAAISPLYGKKIGHHFCILETGYILEVLQDEASLMGWKMYGIIETKANLEQKLNLEDNDTCHSFSIRPIEHGLPHDDDEKANDYPNCFVYLKSCNHNKDQWFIYDNANKILRIDRTKSDTDQEQTLIFVDDDENKVIFNNCHAAIFFVGEPKQAIHAGTMAHLLMCTGLEIDIAGLLATAFAQVLARWSEHKHFAINMPIFSRMQVHPEINNIIGDFTSVLPLEIKLQEDLMNILNVARQIQMQLWEDLDHASYSGVAFISDLMQTHNTREIMLPVVFTCELDVNGFDPKKRINNAHNFCRDEPVYAITQAPQIWLDNQTYEDNDERLVIDWDYVDGLFPPEMMQDMQKTYTNLLYDLAVSDDTWHHPCAFSLPVNQSKRRVAYNQTNITFSDGNKLIHTMITEQAERTADAWAVYSSRGNLTYKQLVTRAYPLAHYLQQQGAKSNQLIA
ncbi:unnamed protein product, partial [Rotaria sp. Silwood1]